MVNRPNDFDPTIPTGSSSPRAGDDELRRIKAYTQNAYQDLTFPEGSGIERTDLYGNTITAIDGFTGNLTGDSTGSHNGPVGAEEPADIAGVNITATEGFVGNIVGNLTGNTEGSHNGLVGDTTPTAIVGTSVRATDGFVGDLIGNVSGAVSGGVMGDVVGNVTGDVTGNASTADAWSTARTLTLTGDVTGSAMIDGSGNVTLTTDLQATATQGTQVASAARWTDARTVALTGAVTGSVGGVDGSGNVSIPTSFSQPLQSISTITPTDGAFLVGSGTTWVSEAGATVRASLGLGSAATSNTSAFATAAQGQRADSAAQNGQALDTGTGTLTVNGVTFLVSGGSIRVSSGGVTLFSVNTTTGDAIFRGEVTARGTP